MDMSGWSIASYLLVVVAGISVALQQVLNANLRAELGSPWWAGFVSYLVGFSAMLLVALFAPGPRPSMEMIGHTNFLSWAGGLLGAIFVSVAILMIPRLGAAMVLALIVVGQMACSLVVDHFGLLGVPHHAADPMRLLGAALLVLSVVLIRQ
jgi:bacterial/archaeal transporter family-2 protein